MKPTVFDPEGAALIGDVVFGRLKDERDVLSIGGLELGAVPLVAAVTRRSWPERPIPGFVIRKQIEGHWTNKIIEGNFQPNTTVVLIEDVTTKGGSVMKAVQTVRAQGATVKSVITIVDRLEGAEENLRKEGHCAVADIHEARSNRMTTKVLGRDRLFGDNVKAAPVLTAIRLFDVA